jgi:tRNA threonylcarbamoyladenosine modification (KEOPS) complex  Pcc1 subunit
MKTEALIRLDFPSEKKSQTVFKALSPEIKKPLTSRSIVSMEKKGRLLVLRVKARDTAALRTALNSYLRWANSTINSLEVLEKRTFG